MSNLNKTTPSAGDRLKIYAEKALRTFYDPFEFDPNEYFSVSSLMSKEPLWGKHVATKSTGSGQLKQVGKELTDTKKLYNMLGSVASKSLGFASIAAIAHLALRKAKNRKQAKNLRSYLNASYPIMSLNPSVRDVKQEEKEREFGIKNVKGLEEEQERAQKTADGPGKNQLQADLDVLRERERDNIPLTPGSTPEGSQLRRDIDPINAPFSFVNELVHKGDLIKMPMHPVLQLIVPLAVAYSAYRGLDKALDVRERKQLEELNARKRNILKSMMHSEYQRTRGGEKEAGEDDGLLSQGADLLRKFWSGNMKDLPPWLQTIGKGVRHPIEFGTTAVPVGFALWAIASTALAYQFAKTKFDRDDPRRKRMKTLERFLRRRAVTSAPPLFVSEVGFLVGEKPNKKRRVKTKQRSVNIPEATDKPETKQEVDERDPYAALLN